MLPGMDGLSLARKVRERWNTPIIMVTAAGDDADKIVGLELGADDYLAKPFNPRELLARIPGRVAQDRARGRAPLPDRGLVIDFGSREVTVDGSGRRSPRTNTSCSARWRATPAGCCTRDQLLEEDEGDHADEAFDRSIDVHVSRLRQKIELDPRRRAT